MSVINLFRLLVFFQVIRVQNVIMKKWNMFFCYLIYGLYLLFLVKSVFFVILMVGKIWRGVESRIVNEYKNCILLIILLFCGRLSNIIVLVLDLQVVYEIVFMMIKRVVMIIIIIFMILGNLVGLCMDFWMGMIRLMFLKVKMVVLMKRVQFFWLNMIMFVKFWVLSVRMLQ